MTGRRGELARAGEDAAAEHLRGRGLEVVERNYRCPAGEIDIVARERDVLVFVEVKTRSSAGYGEPAEAVVPAKRRKIRLVALHYLAERGLGEPVVRFDVVAILGRPGRFQIRYIRGAF